MRQVSPSDMDAAAELLERVARVFRQRGREGARRAREWATPLKSSQGFGPKNEVSRPTENAALNFDPVAEEWTLLTVDVGHMVDAAVTAESRLLRITTDAVVENQRAGIGHCEDCNRYCTGTGNDRLRLGLCDACRQRQQRREAKADTAAECRHTLTRRAQGFIVCMNCGQDLSDVPGFMSV